MASMRARKHAAGRIPRAPWSEPAVAAYYERQAKRNKYPSPLSGKPQTFTEYLAKYWPEESAIRTALQKRYGPEKYKALSPAKLDLARIRLQRVTEYQLRVTKPRPGAISVLVSH